MDREPQGRVKKKDRTGVLISIVVHVVVIGVVAYFVATSKFAIEFYEKVIKGARDKKEEAKPKLPPAAPRQAPLKAPAGAPPPASGVRRAADAPPAVGEGFALEERKKVKTDSTAGRGPTIVAPPVVQAPVIRAPKLFASAPAKSDIKQLLAERSKAAASTEAFGSEQISKSGVSDAGAILGKVSGATVSEGKFAVVRGLSDRYVSTTLNGVNLPSADPYRQSVPLDLFPAQVIDRVTVTKTFTPDQQGNATGGGIDVITKSFPERPFLTLSLGGEYNTQSSLNERFLTYNGGGLDWTGMDDGTRELPSKVTDLAPQGKRFPDAPLLSGPPRTTTFTNNVRDAKLVDEVTRELGVTEFAPKREAPPLNHNFSMAGGGVTRMLERPLGYFVGTSYKHDYAFYDDGISRRYQSGTEVKNSYRDARSLSVVNWSGMVNLAYQPFEDHELGFTFFYNQNGTDDVRIQDQGFEADNEGEFRKFNLYWTERNLTTYQMKGDHRFPAAGGLQFNWGVALTQTTQDEPDSRFFNDNDTGGGFAAGGTGVPAPNKPTRYFRNLDEDNQNVKLDWTLPFNLRADEEGQFKFGLFESSSERNFTERQFYYPASRGGYNNDPNRFLQENNLGLVSIRTNANGSLRFNFGDYVQIFDSRYDGTRDIQAGYLMLDFPAIKNVRLVGGVRYETTDIMVHSESFQANSITSMKTNDTELSQYDLLPSAGVIFSLTSNMNVRLNFSQTIARPSFRELAAYYSYDPIVNDFVDGNPNLKMTAIDNYDVRWEWFPNPGELLSISLFYKDIKDAIERGNVTIQGDTITYFNNDAKLYGVEFEARKTLDFLSPHLSLFSLGGNFSMLKSEVELDENDLKIKRQFFPDIDDTRPLYDQSPYVLNLDFNYSNPLSGTTAAIIYNVAGPRVVITKLNTRDVYDQPVPVLDFVISQRLGRHTTVKFGAKNLLDPQIERTYGKGSDLLYSSYKRGRAFGLSLSYDF